MINIDNEILSTRTVKNKVGWTTPKDVTGIAKECDLVVVAMAKPEVIPLKTPVKLIRIQKVRGDGKNPGHCRKAMEKTLEILTTLEGPIVISIGGTDRTFPQSTDKRHKKNSKAFRQTFVKLVNHPKVAKIFGENFDLKHPKLISMPLGLNYSHSRSILDYHQLFKPRRHRTLKVSSFNRVRHGPQFLLRRRVNRYCKHAWSKKVGFAGNVSKGYLKALSRYPFTLCVTGGGIDPCPKLYDALLVGVIPIIKRNHPQTKAFKDLPVIEVSHWGPQTITKEKLKKWYALYSPYFLNPVKRFQVLQRMTIGHWIKKMRSYCS